MATLYDTTVFVRIVHIQCGSCQFHFGMDERWQQKCQADHSLGFYCPKCGGHLFYQGDTEAQKLKQQLEAKQRELTWQEERTAKLGRSLQYQKNVARGQKAAKTRALNRIKNGVCPCCNRTFVDLRWHMESKHPDFKIEDYAGTD